MSTIGQVAKSLVKGFTSRLPATTPTVFLAGKAPKRDEVRELLRRRLTQQSHVQRYDVLYPEHLFDELLTGNPGSDLLSFEDMLADSTHATVILVEGAGSICELGAFVNNNKLRSKVIAVIDKRYRNRRNFINLGPVAMLRATGRHAVITHDLGNPDISKLASDVRQSVRQAIDRGKIDETLSNPVRAQYLFLAGIFVLQPEKSVESDLVELLTSTGECPMERTSVVARIALQLLQRRGDISRKGDAFILTTKGRSRLDGILHSTGEGRKFARLFDECRINILNSTLRKL